MLITESLGDGKLVVSKSESKYKSVSGKVVVANRDIETGETKYSKDFPLIKYVTQTGMPMIISTGMTDVEEIQEAIEAVQEGGCEELAILHCVSGYPDDSFSLEEKELKELCVGAKVAWESLGEVDYGRKSSEQGNVKFRRSLYFVKDIQKGEVITREHIKSIRPGFGLMPKYWEKVLQSKAKHNIARGTPISFDLIE